MSFRAEAMRHGLRTVCSAHLLCTGSQPGHLLIWQRHHLAVLHLRATSAIPCSATSSPAHLLCCSRRAQLACTCSGPSGHCAVSPLLNTASYKRVCLQCFTCDCCGSRLGPAIAFIAQTILCIGWVFYASWVTNAAKEVRPRLHWCLTFCAAARGICAQMRLAVL